MHAVHQLWIAFRFCIFVLWTQYSGNNACANYCCELLSDFVYSFFEHNSYVLKVVVGVVVNCFQILYIRSLNTIWQHIFERSYQLWIAFRFCIFVLWTQFKRSHSTSTGVVNCFQILYIRSLNTIILTSCIYWVELWIAFRFCIFVLWTQFMIVTFSDWSCCELLSDFVYSFFEHNSSWCRDIMTNVVNCFQILYIRSLNTIVFTSGINRVQLWIAFRFCIFVLWTQSTALVLAQDESCELLSDFVYSFFEHNSNVLKVIIRTVVNCFQILYIRSLNTIHGL